MAAQAPADDPIPWAAPPAVLRAWDDVPQETAAREAFVRAHQGDLVDLHDALSLRATRAAPADRAEVLGQLRAVGALATTLGFPALEQAALWQATASKDAAAMAQRHQAFAALHRALARLDTAPEAARRELGIAVAAAQKLATTTGDAALARRATLMNVEAQAFQPTAFGPAVTAAREVLEAPGLPTSGRLVPLLLLEARIAIDAGQGEALGGLLARLRRSGAGDHENPLYRARYLALALTDAELRGARFGVFGLLEDYEAAQADCARLLEDAARLAADPGLAEEIAQHGLHFARHLARAGDHDRAQSLLRAVLNQAGVPAPQRGEALLLLAQEEEARGQFGPALEAARESASLLRDVSRELRQTAPEWAARYAANAVLADFLSATSATLGGALEDGHSALRRGRAGFDMLPAAWQTPRLAARATLAETLHRHARGDFRGAMACAETVGDLLRGEPHALEHLQALFCRTQLLLVAGDLGGAKDVAELACRLAPQASGEAPWIPLAAHLGLAEIHLSAGRFAEALRVLDQGLDTSPDGLEQARPVLMGEARRLRVEILQALPATASPRFERGQVQLLRALEQHRSALLAAGSRPAVLAEWLRGEQLALGLLAGDHEALAAHMDRVRATCAASWPAAGGPALSAEWGEARAQRALIEGVFSEAQGELRSAMAHYDRAASEESWLREDLRWRHAGAPQAERIRDRILRLALVLAVRDEDRTAAGQALEVLEATRLREARRLLTEAHPMPAGPIAATDIAPRPAPSLRKLDVGALGRVLPRGRLALVYVVTSDEVYGLAVTRRDLVARALPISPTRLAAEIAAYNDHLEGPEDAFKRRRLLGAARRLHTALVGPFEAELEAARELVIVPDGVLSRLPFAGLVGPATDGDPSDLDAARFLIEREHLEALFTVPSLGTLAALTPRLGAEVVAHPRALVVTPAVPERPALPRAEEEGARIAGALGAERVERLAGAEADREHLGQALEHPLGLLHFAGHGENADGTGPGLLLAAPETPAGDLLQPRDVVRFRLRGAPLVVLNACVSGRGPEARAAGVLGLPRAFLLAGARSVMATLTRVPDPAAQRFSQAFYAEGEAALESPARGLLRVQRNLLSRPETRWPGKWAPYTVVGLP